MINAAIALQIVSRLKIFSQTTSRMEPWRVNNEQQEILRALCRHRRVITLKARQIGSTSIHAAYVALVAFTHPNTPIAVLNYSFAESKSILRRIKDFLVQLGVRFRTENATELQLQNGSTINAITAVSAIDGESKAGRGRSYRIIYSSETAYYRDSTAVFASITAALTGDGQVIMESTATPGGGTFRHTWNADAGYRKLFFGIEAHAAYRRSAAAIPDAVWVALQAKYGFTDRGAAAWWFAKLHGDFGGDERRALREYPILADHSWTSADGRWVPVDPPVRMYTRDALHRECKIYTAPTPGHYYIASIDTALGAGGDDSVIVVYDCTTDEIVASYCYNGSPIDEVVRVAAGLHTRYGIKIFYIENNGIGTATVLLGRRAGLPVQEIVTNSSNRGVGMLWARRAIGDGLAADESLLENCRNCTVHTSSSGDRFDGRKDFLMALAMIGMNESAWRIEAAKPPPKVYEPGAFRADDLVHRAIKNNRRGI